MLIALGMVHSGQSTTDFTTYEVTASHVVVGLQQSSSVANTQINTYLALHLIICAMDEHR